MIYREHTIRITSEGTAVIYHRGAFVVECVNADVAIRHIDYLLDGLPTYK